MIQSIFILSPTGEVLIERHFRDVTSRCVCDDFWEKASVSLNHHGGISTASTIISTDPFPLYDTVPPIMEVMDVTSGKNVFLFSILRDGLSYLAACPDEVSPLLVLEFLHRIADIFVDYSATLPTSPPLRTTSVPCTSSLKRCAIMDGR